MLVFDLMMSVFFFVSLDYLLEVLYYDVSVMDFMYINYLSDIYFLSVDL